MGTVPVSGRSPGHVISFDLVYLDYSNVIGHCIGIGCIFIHLLVINTSKVKMCKVEVQVFGHINKTHIYNITFKNQYLVNILCK